MRDVQSSYYLLAALGAALSAVGILIRARRADKERIKHQAKEEVWDDLRRSFIADVATNHLPHIQQCLELIARHLEIELPDTPPIRYMPFRPDEKP